MSKKEKVLVALIILATIILVYMGIVRLPCLIRDTTGLYCSFCGGTRAIFALLSGNFYQAIRYNLIIFIDIPLLLVIYILDCKFKDNIKIKKIIKGILIFLIIITILYFILRNIPKFSFLAPTKTKS